MSAENIIIGFKKMGTVALNSGNYSEALKQFTEAIDLFTRNFGETNNVESISRLESSLYSKRSVALLRLSQYYYAIEDANQMITLTPRWFKGYLRKADIELDCGLFEKALKDYHLALGYLDNSQPKGPNYERFISQKIKHALLMMQRERCFDLQMPWIGAALGLVVGMAIITWDYVSHGTRSYLNHPIVKLAVIGSIAYIFFFLANLQRSLNRKHKEELLQPPYGVKK